MQARPKRGREPRRCKVEPSLSRAPCKLIEACKRALEIEELAAERILVLSFRRLHVAAELILSEMGGLPKVDLGDTMIDRSQPLR